LQALNPQDQNLRFQFCVDFQERLEEDGFAEKLVCSDEATFRVCAKMNRYIVRISGTENPHATSEHVRDSPKMNAFFAVSSCIVYGLFLFAQPTVTGETCKYAIAPINQTSLKDSLLSDKLFLLCLSWLLRCRVRNFQRDLLIILYNVFRL
jgi:hypothetical protein